MRHKIEALVRTPQRSVFSLSLKAFDWSLYFYRRRSAAVYGKSGHICGLYTIYMQFQDATRNILSSLLVEEQLAGNSRTVDANSLPFLNSSNIRCLFQDLENYTTLCSTTSVVSSSISHYTIEHQNFINYAIIYFIESKISLVILYCVSKISQSVACYFPLCKKKIHKLCSL